MVWFGFHLNLQLTSSTILSSLKKAEDLATLDIPRRQESAGLEISFLREIRPLLFSGPEQYHLSPKQGDPLSWALGFNPVLL